jgi:FixJ family two-component response regulator
VTYTTAKLVIVLDDDPSVLGALERVLKAHGFDTQLFDKVGDFLGRLAC